MIKQRDVSIFVNARLKTAKVDGDSIGNLVVALRTRSLELIVSFCAI